jgi:hypothetical protein
MDDGLAPVDLQVAVLLEDVGEALDANQRRGRWGSNINVIHEGRDHKGLRTEIASAGAIKRECLGDESLLIGRRLGHAQHGRELVQGGFESQAEEETGKRITLLDTFCRGEAENVGKRIQNRGCHGRRNGKERRLCWVGEGRPPEQVRKEGGDLLEDGVAINRVERVGCIPSDNMLVELQVLAHCKRDALGATRSRNAKLLMAECVTNARVATNK